MTSSTEERRAASSAPRGTSKGTPLSASVRLARTMRWAMVGSEGILTEVRRQAEVAHDARQAGDEARRLDPPDRLDRAMGVGSRHGLRSEHLAPAGARPAGAGPQGLAPYFPTCSRSRSSAAR